MQRAAAPPAAKCTAPSGHPEAAPPVELERCNTVVRNPLVGPISGHNAGPRIQPCHPSGRTARPDGPIRPDDYVPDLVPVQAFVFCPGSPGGTAVGFAVHAVEAEICPDP